MKAESASGLDVRGYLRILSRRKKTIALLVGLAVTAALVLSFLQDDEYQGEVKVLFQRRETEVLFDRVIGERPDPVRRVETEIEVVKSEAIEAAVTERLGPVRPVGVTPVGDTDIITIKGRAETERRAADVALAYANAYLEFRRLQEIEDLRVAARNLEAKVSELQRQIDAINSRPADQRTSREPLLEQQALFKQRLDELQVEAELRTGGAQLVTRGPVPTVQTRPTPVKNVLLALSLSLLSGIALALFLESLDDSVKTKDELEQAVPGVAVLALIPTIEAWRDRSQPLVVTLSEPSSPPAEAYRSLRTSLQFIGVHKAPRIFQITSANAGDGKTSTLANLGVVLARAGARVVMVDCDLRNPRLHEFFGLSDDMGFTSVFLDNATLSAAVQRVNGVENLAVLPSGPLPPNPSEVLSSKRTGELLESLHEDFDIVLVDCPPVLPVADAVALSVWVEATLFVVGAGITTRQQLQRAVEVLLQSEAPVVGTVLTRVRSQDSYGYYPYRYERGERGRRKSRSGRRRRRTQRHDVLASSPPSQAP